MSLSCDCECSCRDLKGNEVVKALGVGKGGAWTGEVLSRVVEWQLANPQGTKAECERWLRVEHAAGRVVVDTALNGNVAQPKRIRNEGEAGGGKRPKK